jgi:two-component system, NtrC family, response regulator GlrR
LRSEVPHRTPASVLIVDDDRVLLETTGAMLEGEFSVCTAESGPSALELLGRERFHVVCADYDMPEMDGITLLRRVHSLYPATTGILITGLRDQLPPGILREEGVFAVVYKPYTPESLFRTIRDAWQMLSMTRAVASFGASSRRLLRDKGKR